MRIRDEETSNIGGTTMTIQIKRVANGYIADIEGHEYVGTSVNDIMRVVMQQPIWDLAGN